MGNDANGILGLFPLGIVQVAAKLCRALGLGGTPIPAETESGVGGSTTVDEVKMNQKAGWSRQMRDYNLCTTEP